MSLRSRPRTTNQHQEDPPESKETSSEVIVNGSSSQPTDSIILPKVLRLSILVLTMFFIGVSCVRNNDDGIRNSSLMLLAAENDNFSVNTTIVAPEENKERRGESNSLKSSDFNNGDCSSNGLFDGRKCHPNRMRQTPVDLYFQEHHELPLPKAVHATVPKPLRDTMDKKNILVIGDVHGCFQEMLKLYEKALRENNNKLFEYVILTGDMTNKGPNSAKVVQWVRKHSPSGEESEKQHWLSVRGNNDNTVLLSALGSTKHRNSKIHHWLIQAESILLDDKMLTDEDVVWMSELPYTITIPESYFDDVNYDYDTTTVHAGFLPHISDLESQDTSTLTLIRNAYPLCDDEGKVRKFSMHQSSSSSNNKKKSPSLVSCKGPTPWAKAWKGGGGQNKDKTKRHIIFGHDADRGLQQHKWATGIDTGAYYQNELTGLILPEHTLVSISTSGGCRPCQEDQKQ